jgi:hypothetical protein
MEQKIFLSILNMKMIALTMKLEKKKKNILKNMILIEMVITKMKVAILELQMEEAN